VTPRNVALILAEPGPVAVTRPYLSTRATAGLLLCQFVAAEVTGTFTTLAKVAFTWAFWRLPATMVEFKITFTKDRAPGLVTTLFGPVTKSNPTWTGSIVPL